MAASGLLEIDDARGVVLDSVRRLPAEPVELRASLGRVLARDVTASAPVPPFDASAMDGYAVRAADVEGAVPSRPLRLRVVDESRAGMPARAVVTPGEAIAISTGAMMPGGADAVVPIEEVARANGIVDVCEPAPAGRHVRRAGEDVPVGHTVLRQGELLGAAQLGVLASLGHQSVLCARRPRVSVLVSGSRPASASAPVRSATRTR
jgi:molybdopterin molybdotransferase